MDRTLERQYYAIGALIVYAHERSRSYPDWTTEHLTFRRAITMLQSLAETMEAERLTEDQAFTDDEEGFLSTSD